MDNSLDRNQLWSPPIARGPQQYHLQSQPEFLLAASHPNAPSSTTASTRRRHDSISQIQLQEHQPYPRAHISFPQHQRYVPDVSQVHTHTPAQRRPFTADGREDTPGPSHTSAEEEVDEYPNANGNGADADHDSNRSESHEREGRLGPDGDDDAPIDEEPLYVNAKQYNRILKRRVARARLEELHRLSRQRKPYLHESRHKHAMRRPRGPGGRFLTAEEIAAQQRAVESSNSSAFTPNPNPSAEERKAMKAADTAGAGSNVDSTQKNGLSFGPIAFASNGETRSVHPEFRPFENTVSNAASNPSRDTSGGFSMIDQRPSTPVAHVQFSNLGAGPSSGT